MEQNEETKERRAGSVEFYCPRCTEQVLDPLVCGDCASVICRKCGMPLERIDELGLG